MRTFKRCLLVGALAISSTFSGLSLAADNYPSRDINAIIQWGAGGLTDIVTRRVAPLVEEELGRKIIATNRTGGSGVVGANFVLQQPANGYTLLVASESQSLFRLNGLAAFDFNEFTPINILMTSDSVVLVANNKVPADNFAELAKYVAENPRKIKQYSPGLGTTGFSANAMLATQTSFETTMVPFDGDGPALAAIQGGHIDIGMMALNSASDHIKAGRVKALGVINTQPAGDIPSLVTDMPGLEKYLPWGSWIGVFVRKDTPEPIKEKLIEAFHNAAATPEYGAFITQNGGRLLNLSGQAAQDFMDNWQSTTAWLYEEVGASKVSPDSLGIPKPAYLQ
ncbi:Bug family tripartite tricarboxylate transporter substrate binding protein [Paenalcaligenes hominis]|uniref:Bug family tripartite tricarboxylate transporter substrate binding protein n=1 Tax=Paenalcaligenes hominis TaxID=643674 RepID=UPI0035234ACA